jgi:hypothetical protein
MLFQLEKNGIWKCRSKGLKAWSKAGPECVGILSSTGCDFTLKIEFAQT